MVSVHHVNCGYLQRDNAPKVGCHCTLIDSGNEVVLLDAGIGIQDIRNPEERIGNFLIEAAGFKFNQEDTALVQLARLGLQPSDVTHCVVSHLDPDHIGGLADFPGTIVYVSKKEYDDFALGHPRYRQPQMEHHPNVETHGAFKDQWFELPACHLKAITSAKVYLVPLPGHTLGHCGVGIQTSEEDLFYVGDAYGLAIELETDNHPALQIARANAMDIHLWAQTLKLLKLFKKQHPYVKMYGYHDLSEYLALQSQKLQSSFNTDYDTNLFR